MTLSTTAQIDSRWRLLNGGKVAIGPSEDVFKWAANKMTINQQRRDLAIRFTLLMGENEALRRQVAAKDSSFTIMHLAEQGCMAKLQECDAALVRCEGKKPRKLLWFAGGLLGGFILGTQVTKD